MITKTVEAFLEKHNLTNCNILVAFSGGFDSMCLLHILKKLAPKHNLTLTAIHLNHGWRGEESDLEELNCKNFCDDINFYSEKLPPNIPHTETAARNARYSFFEKCAKKFNSTAILTAHNTDDNAETIYYRLIKGTGLTGLEGIPEKRGIFYRPLLTTYRKDIEEYCKKENLTPNNDSSNQNTKYARNKIRNEIFPKLEEILPDFKKNLLKLSQSAKFANTQLEMQIKPLLEYSTAEFINLNSDLKNAVVHKFLRKEQIDYDFKKITEIVTFIENTSSSKSGKTVSLTTDKWLFVNNKYMETTYKNTKEIPEIPINKLGEFQIGDYIFSIKEEQKIPNQYPNDTELIAYVTLNNLDGLTLRGRKEGDIIQPLGVSGNQKLKKYLNAKKIPKHKKDQLVFLCKDNEVLWAAGLGINDKIKVVTNPTHVIKLRKED